MPQAAKTQPPVTADPVVSEGVRQDLVQHGETRDPVTGRQLVMDRETGKISYQEGK